MLLSQPGDLTATDATTAASATSTEATGDTAAEEAEEEGRGTRPERMCAATTEPNKTTSAKPNYGL